MSIVLIGLVVAGTGLVGGYCCWAFSGRRAGRQRHGTLTPTQVSSDGTTKTTTYTVNMDMEAASQAFIEQMIGTNWVSIPNIGQDPQYGWIERSKNFSIPVENYHHYSECPAYLLKVETKGSAENASE